MHSPVLEESDDEPQPFLTHTDFYKLENRTWNLSNRITLWNKQLVQKAKKTITAAQYAIIQNADDLIDPSDVFFESS